MAWFQKMCRNAGLLIHHTVKPVKEASQKQAVSKTVEEQRVDETTTLRRTTIEEIEVKRENV